MRLGRLGLIDNVGSLMFADNLVHVGFITNAENSE